MAFHPLRLRRALSLSYSLLERSVHGYNPQPFSSICAARPLPTPAAATQLMRRPFTSTTTLFRKPFNPESDEIGPDTILFEGCDYKHWLITVDFPKDSSISREEMIDTYVEIAAQVFGSVEEAKKKIYALSTTTYQGFQVECSEATSEKFKSIPQVVFVLPDSYIDPDAKEYGGDKYVNGEIFPRPPPVHYGRTNNRDRRPREQNYGPPPQQNYGPPPQQNHRPPPQQNYGPPPQQNYGPPPQQNLRPPPQQNYGQPPQQNTRPPPQQNFGQPPQQNFGQPPQQNFGQSPQQNFGKTPQPNFGTPPQQNFGTPPQQNFGTPRQPNFGTPPPENFGPPRQPNYGPPPPENFGPPPPQQNFGPPPPQNFGPPPQQNYGSPSYQNYASPQQQNYKQPQPGYTSQPRHGYGSPPEQSYTPSTRGSYGNSSNLPPYPNKGSGEISGYNSSDPEGKHQSPARPGQGSFPQDADYGSSQDGAFGQVSGGYRSF